MRFGSRSTLLLVVALAALSFGAASAHALATVTVNGVNTTEFSGNGSAQFTGTITFGTITCTDVDFSTANRGAQGNGQATTTLVFNSCSAFGAGTCDVSTIVADSEIDGTTGRDHTYTVDQGVNTTIVCDSVVDCTANAQPGELGGVITDVDDPQTATLEGHTTSSAGTTHCTANATITITILTIITITITVLQPKTT